MISEKTKQVLSTVVCLALIPLGVPKPATAQDTGTTQSASSTQTPAIAPLTTDQLDTLVAPIALYPDALVAQVLAASMYTDEVAMADLWLKQNQSLTGSALTSAVDQQSWDPSVKALTQFPSVLSNLANNLSWTSSLGEAFSNQQADVMSAVQDMRAKAQAAGTLNSTSQLSVTQQGSSTIVIQPANPSVVYVPQYNPALVYGAPVAVPLYTPPVAVAAATLSFGAGVAIGAAFGGGGFVGGGGFSWGFSSWNCNWGGGGGGGNVIYNHNTYINKTVINHTTNAYNNYHPWGPVPHGQGPSGPRPDGPNGYHPYGPDHPGPYHPTGYGPNGDANRPGGGGFRPDEGGNRPDGYHPQPDGGRNGDHGLIGGQGGTQHLLGSQGAGERNPNAWNRARTSPQVNQPRSYMSGNGDRDRAAANRGRASMHPQPMHRAPQRASAPHNNGGARRR